MEIRLRVGHATQFASSTGTVVLVGSGEVESETKFGSIPDCGLYQE